MHVLFAALIALGIAGVISASAADLVSEDSTNKYKAYSTIGTHTAPLIVYDYQPGVVMRSYWLAPWRYHHYYPATGEMPGIGRYEDLSAPSSAPEPAETFMRYWSTSFFRELPPPSDAARVGVTAK